MEGAREVFCAMFQLIHNKNLITDEEFNKLKESVHGRDYHAFVDTVEDICKEGQ